MAGAIRSASLAAAASVLVLAAAATASAAVPTKCPSASVVSAALGTTASTPTLTKNPYGISCKYGTSALAPKVEFQRDTASTFAAGEKAASAALHPTKVQHLGKAAWGTSSGGFLDVFTGAYSVKLLAPLTSLAKLEALARKLL
jgi:hypothetical protein